MGAQGKTTDNLIPFGFSEALKKCRHTTNNMSLQNILYEINSMHLAAIFSALLVRKLNKDMTRKLLVMTLTPCFSECGGLVSIYFFLCIFFALLTYQNIVKQNLNIHRSEAIYHTHYTVLPNKRRGQNLREGKKCGLFKFCKARFPSPGGSV